MELDKNIIKEIIKDKEQLTYKKLCERLNIKYVTGKSKIYQIESLNKICDCSYDKSIKRYVISRMRTEEEIMESKLDGVFQDVVECCLSNTISQYEGYCKTFTNSELLLEAGLVSEDMKVSKFNPHLAYNVVSSLNNDFEGEYVLFKQFVNTNKYIELALVSYLMRALGSLEKKSIIKVREAYRSFNYVIVGDNEVMDNINDIEIGSELESLVLTSKKNVWNRYGFDTLESLNKNLREELSQKEYDAIKSNLNNDYNEEFYKLTNKEYHGFYKCFHITYSNASLRDNAESMRLKANKDSIEKILSLKSFKKTESYYSGFMKIMVDSVINYERPYKLLEVQKKEWKKNRLS